MGSAFIEINSSTGIPSINIGRLTLFCLPLIKMVMYSSFLRFLFAFSWAVSFRLIFGMIQTRNTNKDAPDWRKWISAIDLGVGVCVPSEAGAGTSDAASGNYTYTINGFGTGDKVDFPAGNEVSVINNRFTDGMVELIYALAGRPCHDIDFALFDKDNRHALLDWNGFQWWQHGVRCFPLRLQTRQPALHADQDSAHRAAIG